LYILRDEKGELPLNVKDVVEEGAPLREEGETAVDTAIEPTESAAISDFWMRPG
jgi:hypothetical protein